MAISPNWLALKQRLRKNRPAEKPNKESLSSPSNDNITGSVSESTSLIAVPKITRAVAIDCEMVGIGVTGRSSMLARVSVVNERGECLYDSFVKPKDYVTDLRTHVSGVRFKDILGGKELTVVQKEVFDLLNGRIVIGHALKHDFKALLMSHPKRDMRDSSRYKPFRRLTNGKTPGLKTLAKLLLGKVIQEGEHSSVEDARATMQIYVMHKKEWEESLRSAISAKRISIGKSGTVHKKLKPKKAMALAKSSCRE